MDVPKKIALSTVSIQVLYFSSPISGVGTWVLDTQNDICEFNGFTREIIIDVKAERVHTSISKPKEKEMTRSF